MMTLNEYEVLVPKLLAALAVANTKPIAPPNEVINLSKPQVHKPQSEEKLTDFWCKKYNAANAKVEELSEQLRISVECNKKLQEQVAVLTTALEDANSVCRSSYSVAARGGVQTGWAAFTARIKESLLRQHKVMYPGQYKDD